MTEIEATNANVTELAIKHKVFGAFVYLLRYYLISGK